MLPPVSVPIAAAARLATVATADPPEDPPATRVVSNGLRTDPKCGFVLVTPAASLASSPRVGPEADGPGRRTASPSG